MVVQVQIRRSALSRVGEDALEDAGACARKCKRRRNLEEGYNGLKKRQLPQTLKAASDAWLELKRPTVAPKTHRIERTNLAHMLPVLGQKFLSDIDPDDIGRYQQQRLREKASPKTVNLEVGTIRAILRRHRLWANLQPDVRMLPTSDDVGKALSIEDEKRLLDGCAESRSRSLLPAVLLALEHRHAVFGAASVALGADRSRASDGPRWQEQD